MPFEGAYGQVLAEISTGKMQPISAARPDVSAPVVRILERVLARDPDERFGSMSDLHDALGSALPLSPSSSLFSFQPTSALDSPTRPDSPAAHERMGLARRRYARAPYVTLAQIRRGDGRTIDGRIEEISESGFQFVSDRIVANGESVKVRFALPATGRVTEAAAISRWNRSTRGLMASGFELTSLADEARGEIRRYVAILCVEG